MAGLFGSDNLVPGSIQNPQTFYSNSSGATLPGLNSPDGFGIFGTNLGNQQAQIGQGFNWQGIGQGLGAFTSLANLYGMFKNLKLQNEAFAFNKEGVKRNFNAGATGFNNEVGQYQAAREASALSRNREVPTNNTPQKVGLWG